MNKVFLVNCTLLMAFGSNVTYAIPVRVDVTGFVKQVDDPFFGLVSFGDPMSGYFIYDAELVTRRTMFGFERIFYYGPVVEYELNLGSITGSGGAGRIEVTNDYTDSYSRFWDRLIVQSGGVEEPVIPVVEAAFPTDSLSVGFTFYDYDDADALASADLPPTIPLGSMDIANGRSNVSIQAMPIGTGEWEAVFAEITSATQQVIPEPSAVSLAMFGIASACYWRHRR